MGKKIKYIVVALVVIALIVAIALGIKSCTQNAREEREDKEEVVTKEEKVLEVGAYMDEALSACIIIEEGNIATFYPNFLSEYSYEGVYTIEDNMFTITQGSSFWKFKIIKDKLHYIQCRQGGAVVDCREDERVFSLMEEVPDNPMNMAYLSRDGGYLFVSEDYAKLEGNIGMMSRSYTYEDNILYIESTSVGIENARNSVSLLYQNGNFYIQDGWYNGMYFAFEENEKEYVPVYKTVEDSFSTEGNYITENEYYEFYETEELEAGRYYNQDYTSELIIYSDSTAQYFPSTKSMSSYEGYYHYEDDVLTLIEISYDSTYYDKEKGDYMVEVVGKYTFQVQDETFTLIEAVDRSGQVISYEPGQQVFTSNTEGAPEYIRAGYYEYSYYNEYYMTVGGEEYLVSDNYNITVNFDGKSQLSLSYCFDRPTVYDDVIEVEFVFYDQIYDDVMGTYEVVDNRVIAKFANDITLNMRLENGQLIIEDLNVLYDSKYIEDTYKEMDIYEFLEDDIALEYDGCGMSYYVLW